MDFLLTRTTRTRQWWRDGEGVLVHARAVTLPRQTKCTSAPNKPAQPTTQQMAKGRRITSPVLLPLTAGDGR